MDIKIDDELLAALLEKAQGEHTEMFIISNLPTYYSVRDYYRAVKKVSARLGRLSKFLSLSYCASIVSLEDNFDILQAANTCLEASNYYKEETKLARYMLKEFREYTRCGHIIKTLLGFERSEEDMIDYCTLKYGFRLFG